MGFLTSVRSWLSAHKKETALAAIVFLVSTLSFGAGYLANREFNHAPIIIEACAHPEMLK